MPKKSPALTPALVGASATPTAALVYRIDARDTQAHLYRIHLQIAQPQAQQRVSLPAWIPGSYLLREFAKHVQNLRAEQGGRALALLQLDKNTWQIDCSANESLDLHYEVYAFDASVRTAWLDSERGFFNPTSLCLQVQGQSEKGHALELVLDEKSVKNGVHAAQAATQRIANTFHFFFSHYDALADTPFVFAAHLWRGEFQTAGIAHAFVIVDAPPNLDGDKLLHDARLICEAQQKFWGGEQLEKAEPPIFDHYLFMLHATEDGYGGLEHMASTALIAARQDLPQRGQSQRSKAYVTLLGLISHEYFHSWNVKRLRPQELAQYDYSRENYTELLWFFEGFTSYYDDLFLRRTGLIDDAQYLQLVARNIQALAINPGAQVQSVAQASFDAWTKYYRPDENTPNATVSYYIKGALIALCLDLTLRQEGRGTLDAAMQRLWRSNAQPIKPITEADIAAALQAVGGRSFAPELQAWVYGREDLPLQALLDAQGIHWQSAAPTWAQRLGIKVQEGAAAGAGAANGVGNIKVQNVLRGSAAEKAGLAAGDEWLGVTVLQGEKSGEQAQSWRLRQLEQLGWLLPLDVQMGKAECEILYSREQRILHGRLHVPAAAAVLRELSVNSPEKVRAWLQG